jgi:hypothetical protein
MQMQLSLPPGSQGEFNAPACSVEFAGSIRGGQLKWNSLFNNPKFCLKMNGDMIANQWRGGPDKYDRWDLRAQEQRAKLKKQTPDTQCTKSQQNKVKRMWADRIKLEPSALYLRIIALPPAPEKEKQIDGPVTWINGNKKVAAPTEAPKEIVVKEAGYRKANGTYTLQEEQVEGRPMWRKLGKKGGPTPFSVRYNDDEDGAFWIIDEDDEEAPYKCVGREGDQSVRVPMSEATRTGKMVPLGVAAKTGRSFWQMYERYDDKMYELERYTVPTVLALEQTQ